MSDYEMPSYQVPGTTGSFWRMPSLYLAVATAKIFQEEEARSRALFVERMGTIPTLRNSNLIPTPQGSASEPSGGPPA